MGQFTDIVFPNGNEEKFLKLNSRLGVSSLIFCYTPDTLPADYEKINDSGDIRYALLANISQLQKYKSKNLPMLYGRNDRFVFEQNFKKPLIIFGIESASSTDSMHSRHSGLNHILCSLAEKNNIYLGISLYQLLTSESFKRPYIIGRMAQNIILARKFGMKLKLASFARTPFHMRSYNDFLSLGKILGMNSLESKKALSASIS